MNKVSILLVFLAIFSTSFIAASGEVSKEVQKRNVLFEQFTGIDCESCPEAHKHARILQEEYAGKFFTVNIHQGKFANSTPDLRINEGIEIGKNADAISWPSASINRLTTGWAVPRLNWTDGARHMTTRMVAPVNILTKASVDHKTRKLSVEVEYYYTGYGLNPSNFLTVVLTQSNIIAKQAGAEKNAALLAPNGRDYRHSDVLRMVLSSGGAFGQEIASTNKGSTQTIKFEKILPASIKGIDVDLNELNVVALIATRADGYNVLNAHGAYVENNDPNKVDLVVEQKTEIPSGHYVTELTPKITVTNKSNNTIKQFEVEYRYNGKSEKKQFNGNLGAGKSVDITWDKFEIDTVGEQIFEIGFIKNIQPSVIESNYMNNFSIISFKTLKRNAFSSSIWDFEGKLENMHMDISQNREFHATALNQQNVGINKSKLAMVYFCYKHLEVAGKPADLIFGGADLSKVKDANLSYYYAYSTGGKTSTKPVMKLSVSEDLGKNWKEIHSQTFDETGTVGSRERVYIPKDGEYKPVTINLNNYSGTDNLTFRLRFIPGTDGANALIDDLKISSTKATGAVLSLSSLDFNKVELNNKSEIAKVKITNTGNSVLIISGVDIEGSDKDNFNLSNNINFPIEIESKNSKNLEFIFNPKKYGQLTANAVIKTNVGEYDLELKGTAVKSSVLEGVRHALNYHVTPTIASDQVRISYNLIGSKLYDVDLTIYDQLGQVIETIQNESLNGLQTKVIDVSNFTNGIVYIRLSIDGDIFTEKIVMQK